MQVSELIRKAQAAELRTEMEVFLAHLLGVSRLDLIAHGEQEVPVAALASLQQAWVKMQEGYPVAYLTHEKEFYGLNFYVDERVLVPRDATERLVDYVLARPAQHVLESGTGSGAIAVAVKKTDSQSQVSATDVSADALEGANKNCVQNEVLNQQIHLSLRFVLL